MKYAPFEPPVLFLSEPTAVGAYEAKTRLGEILTDVEHGASYVITKHGRPIARLLPISPPSDTAAVVDALLAEREGRTLDDDLLALIAAGRR
mgnify:CR=1 FL=1